MAANLHDVFVSLRAILEPYGSERGFIQSESDDRFALSSATKTDRVGRRLFVAAVEVNKRYVSYHLMPIYIKPELLKSVPPSLKKRMQGKACFNFTAVDDEQLKELAAVTKAGIAVFRDLKLPWAQPTTRTANRTSPSARR